ncbi:MAG: cupin domain-containing protein, partial [Synechococcaceae bacterium WBB_3_034]|nr:cupin domain-containing protein [Synechococcaceae bacterium WBB_3_034]
MNNVDALIARLGLQPHPEGGFYRELHRSPLAVQRGDGQARSALTVILFLLPAGAISRWHRVQGADESWHFIGGDPLELLQLPPTGGEAQASRLGFDPVDGALLPVAVVPSGWWQAARSLGAWSLVSCCVGPGFSFD